MSLDDFTRLDELRRYELFDSGGDAGLDRLAELVARGCNAPVGVISFVDDTHQRMLARWGVGGAVAAQIPLQESICATTIEQPQGLLIVADLTVDPRFAHMQFFRRLGLVFYAGAPLVTPGGHVLGTVCVVDRRARTLDDAESRVLGLVRDQVMDLLEARRELGELRRSESLRQEAVEALVATQHDLTRRIELRTREIEESHKKTRQILERIGDAYVALDRGWRCVYANERAAQLFGRRADELVGKQLWTEFPEGIGAPFRPAYERAMQEQVMVTLEAYSEPWGRWFDNRIYPSANGISVFLTEITDRKRAEAAAQKIHARLLEAQRVAHVGSWEWDVASNQVLWSDELYRIYGVAEGAPTGGYEGFLGRVHPADLGHTKEVIGAAISAGAPFIYDHRIVRPDGSTRMLHTRGEVIAVDGKPVRLVGACWDITELHHASEALQRTVALLEATLEVTSDGLLVLDAGGKVTAYNARLAALFTLTAGPPAPETLERIAARLRDPSLLLERARALAPGDQSVDTLTLADGRVLEARSRPHLVGGEVAGRVWSFRSPPHD